MKRLVSALYPDFHPFYALDIEGKACVDKPEELKEGDILIVHGGGDIHPSLYGKKVSRSYVDPKGPSRRDNMEWALMQRAVELKIPILGICRGAQMLCAVAGGYLIQHVNNHGGHHEVTTNDGKTFDTNSIHHQMMQPKGTDHELVAWTTHKQSDVYIGEDGEEEVDHEPEFVYFNAIKGFAFQWHPEAMGEKSPANQYILNYIKERI